MQNFIGITNNLKEKLSKHHKDVDGALMDGPMHGLLKNLKIGILKNT